MEADEEKEENNVLVKSIDKDSKLTKEELDPKQHFTQPPAHYTEASLVKALEELGSGVQVRMRRQFQQSLQEDTWRKENKNLYMTEIGEVVNNIMKQSFTKHRR